MWWANLDAPDAPLQDLLSAAENLRAARILSPVRQRRWRRSRNVLRELLARYLDTDARSLELVAAARGKPRLLDGSGLDPSHGLHFSVSHSSALGLFGFSRLGPIGVDIELVGRIDVERAERRLGARTAEPLDEQQRGEHSFLGRWVQREAAAKCLATGLAADQASLDATWSEQEAFGAIAVVGLASTAAPGCVRRWRWEPASQHGAEE